MSKTRDWGGLTRLSSAPLGVVLPCSSDRRFPRVSIEAQLSGSVVHTDAARLDSLGEARKFLDASAESTLLAIINHPVQGLARALNERPDESVSALLDEVCVSMRGVLDVVRTYGRRVSIIDGAALSAEPERIMRSLRDLKGLAITISEERRETRKAPSPLELGLAELLLSRHPSLRRQFSELEAALVPPSSTANSASMFPDAIGELRYYKEEASRCRDLKSALSSLENDFRVAARNEAKYSQRNLALLREVAELSRKREDSEKEVVRLEAHVAQMERAQRRLSRECRDLQQKLESYVSKRNFHRTRRLAAEAQVTDLRGEIDRIHRSRSWRLTAPLRYIKVKIAWLKGM